MPRNIITEQQIEEEALRMLEEEGYEYVYGPDIAPAPEGKTPERERYSDVVLVGRLRKALERINPKAPKEAIEEAIKKILRDESQNLIVNNQHFHKFVADGISVPYRKEGEIRHVIIQLFDFE